jgi:hypothetical protein
MMNLIVTKPLSTLGLALFMIVAGCSTPATHLAGRDAGSLAREYKLLTTEQEKVRFCFLLMEQGTIGAGVPVSFLREVFGSDFSELGPSSGKRNEARVYLIDESWKKDSLAQWPPAWSLTVEYSGNDGSLIRCYLECPPEGK